ncbi:pol polyprotein [Tanacetum coccineum]
MDREWGWSFVTFICASNLPYSLSLSLSTLSLYISSHLPSLETSVANDTSGLVPQRQKASDYDNPDPAPELQNVSPSADTTVLSQQELDLLFGPLYDEFFNDGTSRVNKSSSPTNNSIQKDTLPSTHIQPTSEPTTPTNVHAEENNDNQAEFTNPFCTPVQEIVESSSRNIGNSNVHTFNQPQDSKYRWTKDHSLTQVRGNPSKPVQTRRKLATYPEMCMFALTEELHQFNRLQVWELVDKPFGKNVIKLKWLWKQKDEDQTVEYNFQIGALRSPRRELRNELKYVQSEIKMNEISYLKVRHVKHKIWMTNTQTPPPATIIVIPTGGPATNTAANHAEKPEKFNGQNFKRWQQKMFFYLTTLGLAQFLKEIVPQVEPPTEGQSSNAQAVQAVEAWKHLDFLCHNYVLNGLIDHLYNVYCKTTTAKELWESLERKYKTKDTGTKKFVVAQFLVYKMVDSKNVISQVQDLQVLLHNIHAEGMTLSETFQAAAIIEKLPPSWVEFKNYLKHKRKEMSVEDLVVHLRIEEDNKLAQKDIYAPDSAKANMVEHDVSSSTSNPNGKGKDKRKNDKKSKGKFEYLAPKAGIMKQKFQGICYNYDQPGHRTANCKMPKRVNLCQANMVNDDVDMIAMVFDVAVDNGQKLYMGNSATADIKDEGDVVLKMTFEKELKLTNVLYVPEIFYVGKGYAMNGMFKLNVMVVKNEINKMDSSSYLIESSNVWHARLGHKSKDEAIDKFVLYKNEVENQLGKKIKVVRSDRGGKYVSPFADVCAQHGIRHEFTAPYSL